MAWKSGFFNSVSGDRKYNANDISEMFEGMIGNGVFEGVGNQLAVIPHSDMTIAIESGRGWFNNRWVKNDAPYYVDLDDSDVTLNRYAAVCVRVNNADSGRTAEPYVKYGELAANPVKPEMERSDTISEFCLAYVYIGANVNAITDANIEDTRMDSDVCGWVTGLIEQVDTKTLWLQWQAKFYEWFESLMDYMDEDVETKLVADMQRLQARVVKYDAVIDSADWVYDDAGAIYTTEIAVDGLVDTDTVIVNVTTGEDAYLDNGCGINAAGGGVITIQAVTLPEQNIEISFIVMKI